MQIRYIDDKKVWEQFISSHDFESTFFQSWNWGQFQLKEGNTALYLGFYEQEQLVAIALAIVIKAKRGSYLYIRNGPVFNYNNLQLFEQILRQIKQVARQQKLWFIRLSPLVNKDAKLVTILKKYPISPMADVDALDTWVLDVTQSEQQIMDNMRKTTRYEIRKAEKENIKIISSDNPKDIDLFYPIYLDTIRRQKWTGYSKQYIRDQFATFAADQQAKLFIAEQNGVNIAGSIFIYHNQTCYYHYSGSLTAYRKSPGPSLIHWNNILHCKKLGIKKYNFWGIAPENKPHHPWQGLSFFKMGFGGSAKRYFATRDIPINWKYYLTNLFENIQKHRKGY